VKIFEEHDLIEYKYKNISQSFLIYEKISI